MTYGIFQSFLARDRGKKTKKNVLLCVCVRMMKWKLRNLDEMITGKSINYSKHVVLQLFTFQSFSFWISVTHQTELTFAQSPVIGTGIFFVSPVLNLVLIRQERSQPQPLGRADFYSAFMAVIRASGAVAIRSSTPQQACCLFKNRT